MLLFPRVAEPGTGCTDLEWVEASGKGTVYSTTVIRQKPPTPNYNLALIDLAEGARMMSRVEGIPPEEVRIGMRGAREDRARRRASVARVRARVTRATR